MCGIAGTIGVTDKNIFIAMNGAMAHRGPDDHGIYIDEQNRFGFAHRRLSIIDLSSAGHQPMSYLGGRYWIVYNGEIYNYKDIRADLEKKGCTFTSNTDTEVLLAAYAEWGRDCLKKLRGMFAFAIYDKQTSQTFLARDRFGIKPLYYSRQNGFFLFASEIKTLLASGLISKRVDYQAIWDYISIGCIPQPRTILQEVKALLPGHSMLLTSNGEIIINRYWDLWDYAPQSSHTVDSSIASEELRVKLEEATRLHMIADVPVGAFLSGGIDSTAVVGLMSQYVSHPIKTFSVGFESKYAKLNEFKWAKIVSERFNTEHTEVIVTGDDVAREYDMLLHGIDQPSFDGTNTYFVSKAAGKDVKVALSGQGGDELFAGYPHFAGLLNASEYERRFPAWVRSIIKPLISFVPGRYLPNKTWLSLSSLERYAMLRNLANEKSKRKIISKSFFSAFNPKPLTDVLRPFMKPSDDSLALTSYIEVRNYLSNTLLRDGDAVSMAHSLEVRPILLDHILAEYIFTLPSILKLNKEGGKRIFLDALRDLIPESIVHRPKMGFEMPLYDWLAGPLQDRAQMALACSNAKLIFDKQFLDRSAIGLQEFNRRDRRLWGYMMLIEWMNANHASL